MRMFVAIDNATKQVLVINIRDTDTPEIPSLRALLASTDHKTVKACLVAMFGEGDWLRFRYSIVERDVTRLAPDVRFLSDGWKTVPREKN